MLFSLLARAVGVLENVSADAAAAGALSARFYARTRHSAGSVAGSGRIRARRILGLTWAHARLGALDPAAMMRVAIPSVTLMIAGAEVIFSSFLLEFIDVRSSE